MIDRSRQLIFVHQRRTGGNSIEIALGGIILLDKQLNPTNIWDNELHRGKSPYKIDRRGHYIHDTAADIRHQFPAEFQHYKKFSVVRNPWDQLASLYFRFQSHKQADQEFPRWLTSLKRPLPGTLAFDTVFDEGGSCLVDTILRYEALEQEFTQLIASLNLVDALLPKSNTSNKDHYSTYYTNETRDFVAQLCAPEVAYFDYHFEDAKC